MKHKCINCIYYDVVRMECSHLADKFALDEPVPVDFNWGCKDFKSATSKNILKKLNITIDIGV